MKYPFVYVAQVVALTGLLALPARAQGKLVTGDSATRWVRPANYWRDFAMGAVTSIVAHEGGHVVTALAFGKVPSFGFDKGRPTVYSGISSHDEPRKQFLFSSMGLNVQAAMDETILDAPHHRGGAFERGLLAGGIGTALFYITVGRSASVSDVDYMARTSSLSKNDISLIYGGVALMHVIRIHRDGHYANFFARPTAEYGGGLKIGLDVSPQ